VDVDAVSDVDCFIQTFYHCDGMEWKEMGWDGMMNDAEQKKYEARVVEQRQYHPQHIPRGTFTCYGSSN